jgi:alanine or glycine:cation symporter, AGCS family
MTFWSIVGHASFHTAEGSGPSTIERSNFCKVCPSYPTIVIAVLACSPESFRMPDFVRRAIIGASDFVWGPWTTPVGPVPGPLMVLLILTGVYLTVRTGFVQVRRFPEAARTIVPEQDAGAAGALSPFQAFMTALAASIGTGNIAGVATAIVSGGPGALFWIWAYGFIAMAIKFAEAVLGMRFRVAREGGSSSGPMYYLRDGLRAPRLAAVFAAVAGLAALFTTPFTQPNSMAVVLESQFGVPTWAAGIAIAALTWLVIIGGVKSIGRAAEKLSPLKVGLYFAGGLFVILSHASEIPAVIAMVFREAFSFRAALGTSAGLGIVMAMRYGLARGIYANEAGYGTAAVAYGTAKSASPTQQGLNAVIEVFVVSFVTSSISALTILVSGVWRSGATSTAVVAQAFNTAIPVAGGWVVAFCAFLFGYTTLIGWAYYGEQFFEYLFGRRVTVPYRWIYCLLIPIGAVASVETVWAWGDLMNGLQVFPNLVGLVGLSGIVAAAARAGLTKRRG